MRLSHVSFPSANKTLRPGSATSIPRQDYTPYATYIDRIRGVRRHDRYHFVTRPEPSPSNLLPRSQEGTLTSFFIQVPCTAPPRPIAIERPPATHSSGTLADPGSQVVHPYSELQLESLSPFCFLYFATTQIVRNENANEAPDLICTYVGIGSLFKQSARTLRQSLGLGPHFSS